MAETNVTKQKIKEDVTGKDRFTRNVVASWAGYLFVLIPGFIMPRLISDYQGSAALGVWDFTWAFVNYLKISGFGIGSSVSRYVAKHRAEDDVESMRHVVNTVMFIQFLVAVVVALVTIFLSYWLPIQFADSLGEFADETQGVIIFLGLSLVFYFIFNSFQGVITGHHCWGLHNGIIAGVHGANFVLMVVVLMAGGGLLELSIAYCSVIFIGELFRVYWGFKVCPDLKIRFSYVSWKRAKKMMSFGIKTTLTALPLIVILQSTSVLVMGALGAAALAIFVRPVSLIRHLSTFISKYAFVLTPMAGSIQAKNNEPELRDFMVETTKYGLAFTLPPVLFFTVFGDRILYYWMGDGYDEWALMAILALGFLLPISQNTVMRILVGLNAHGKAAVLSLAVAVVTYLGGVLYIEYVAGWSLTAAAMLVAVSLTATQGIAVPLYACYRLNVSVTSFVVKVFTAPILCCSVYLALMVLARMGLEGRPDLAMLLGGFLGGLVVLPLYWKWIAPDSFKEKISRKLQSKFAKTAG